MGDHRDGRMQSGISSHSTTLARTPWPESRPLAQHQTLRNPAEGPRSGRARADSSRQPASTNDMCRKKIQQKPPATAAVPVDLRTCRRVASIRVGHCSAPPVRLSPTSQRGPSQSAPALRAEFRRKRRRRGAAPYGRPVASRFGTKSKGESLPRRHRRGARKMMRRR